ncbi:DEAD/DEAH box helicase family protein [uncultured Methanobrevibacter sp.]|uniref:DEAD/DEAH box helicase family protein n=1 Tax=uncultured Methanobrevibacter sp. TaxID=253161 RepID=UPI002600FA3B|nr:DEAD/DEAH box helicase family protein [uncultured Methanobrevibacter sp.]
MSLKDIDHLIEPNYFSSNTDLIEGFYNLVLTESVRYDRLAGYFSSGSLSVAAKGMTNLIKNNGHIRLLCGVQLSEEDWDSISNPEQFKDLINKNFLDEYENLEDELTWNYTKVLGWMIANGILEMKIGLNYMEGKYVPGNIYHPKLGIFYDCDDNCIVFVGSVNESARGWSINTENLSTYKSWQNDVHIPSNISAFEDFWNDNNDNVKVYDVPDESLDFLIEHSPKDKVELEETIVRIKQLEKPAYKKKEVKTPYAYQLDAIDRWFSNGKRGILAMATGTGKTFTSLNCLKKVLKEEEVLTVIACPYTHLVEQWKEEVLDMDLGKTHEFYGVNSKWGSDFDRLERKLNNNVKFEKPQIILTTQQTFHTPEFISKINNLKEKNFNKNLLLIVDEVHHVGSAGYSEGLLDEYDYRLGLSATPRRYMDYEGTQRIMNYFGRDIFEFTIRDALHRRHGPKMEPFLTPYCYYPIKVKLTEEEAKNRSKANNAEDKYKILGEILDNMEKPIDHLIIFCSPKQRERVLKILNEKKINPKAEFTYNEDLKLRKQLLDDFDKGDCKALVAMRCLNEGVDVPSTDKVIIMSSSSNPAEYIQRRGRVLRRSPGKKRAYIYDLVVVSDNNDSKLNNFFDSELDRLIEFVTDSDNADVEGIPKLKEWGLL